MTDPRQLGAAWIDSINRQDLDALAAVLHPSFVWELGVSSTEGAEASIEAWRLWFAAFPDFRFETVQVIAEQETVSSGCAWPAPISGRLVSAASTR